MSRDWCVLVRPRESAGGDETETIDLALHMREPAFDLDRSDGDFLVFGGVAGDSARPTT